MRLCCVRGSAEARATTGYLSGRDILVCISQGISELIIRIGLQFNSGCSVEWK